MLRLGRAWNRKRILLQYILVIILEICPKVSKTEYFVFDYSLDGLLKYSKKLLSFCPRGRIALWDIAEALH